MRRNVLLILSLLSLIKSYSQQKTAAEHTSIKGVIIDSAGSFPIHEATIALYNNNDTSYINYQLTDRYGEFQLVNIPVRSGYWLLITHVGYRDETQKIKIDSAKSLLSLDTIRLSRKEHTLDEVVVRSFPPVRMNKDTLEFNPDAFKMDKNAVVEDLFRRLNGVKIWGDGKITVNGKEINAIYVNGKQFFSSDYKIALQNIPKAAVEKVQVYSTPTNERLPGDSTTNINIRLKKGSEAGIYGKINAAGGTDRRYQLEEILNYYTPRMQLSAGHAGNNVNIGNFTLEDLQKHTTYKGFTGIGDYYTNFRLPGERINNFSGLKINYDLRRNGSSENGLNSVNVEVNRNKQQVDQRENRITMNYIDPANITEFHSEDNSEQKADILNIKADYITKNNNRQLTLSSDLSSDKYSQNTSGEMTSGTGNDLTSSSRNTQTISGDRSNFNFAAGLSRLHHPTKQIGYELKYRLHKNTNSDIRQDHLYYHSIPENTETELARNYNSDDSRWQHSGNILLTGFGKLLKIRRSDLWPVSISNTLTVTNNDGNTIVQDLNKATNTYSLNERLSNIYTLQVTDNLVALDIKRRFPKFFFNRYNKELYILLSAKAQTFVQKNRSSLDFQNITRKYSKFVPSFEISHLNNRINKFQNTTRLQLASSVGYPRIGQLAPIVDSINIYYLETGNKALREFRKNTFTAGFSHWSQRPGLNMRYAFNMVGANIRNVITTNETIDGSGRITMNFVNGNYENQLSFNGSFEHTIPLGRILASVRSESNVRLSDRPVFFEGVYSRVRSLQGSGNLNLGIGFDDLLQNSIHYNYTYNRFEQRENVKSGFRIHSLKYNLDINLSKRLSFNCNVDMSSYRSSLDTREKFVILNGSFSYRALKNNSLELKMAVLDILNENRTVINEVYHNSVVSGRRNMLSQYCILSLAFYPRNFRLGVGEKE